MDKPIGYEMSGEDFDRLSIADQDKILKEMSDWHDKNVIPRASRLADTINRLEAM